MSFGGSEKSKILEDALQMAYDNNILIFAAAGNGGKTENNTILYPAKYKQVVAVGAIDKNEERAEFSSIGSELELVAPGVDIESTLSDGLYGNKSGTSMAAPHATGVAALLWSKDLNLTNQSIRDLLNQSAVGIGDKGYYGNGIVNARYAMDLYNDFAEVKSGKKDKVSKIKKEKYPESNKKQKSVDPNVTTAGIVETYYLDSAHPYSNNYYNTWTISKPGATNIRVHFTSIQLETGWDWVTTRTAGNVEIEAWTGSNSNFWSEWSGSSSIIIALSSDGSYTDYGFSIDRIEYNTPTDPDGNSMSVATNIQVGTSYYRNIDYVGDVDYFRFTPTVSGNHVIGSTGSTDVYGYLYNSSGTQLDYNDDSNGTANFTITYSLTAYQTYYIQVRHYGSIYGYGTGAYGLSVTAPVANDDHGNDQYNSTTIYADSPRSGNIDYAGDVDFFRFTPTSNFAFVFKTTGSTDTYGYLYDANGSQLNENDDYPYPNFSMTHFLIANQTYYIKVRHYGSGTGPYSVIVTKADYSINGMANNMQRLVDLANQHKQSSGVSTSANELVLQYIRRGEVRLPDKNPRYTGNSEANWSGVAGPIDSGFVTYVNINSSDLKNYFNDYVTIIDPKTYNTVDFVHWAATLNGQIFTTFLIDNPYNIPENNINNLCGWAGDLQSLVADTIKYAVLPNDYNLLYNKATQFMGTTDQNSDSRFPMDDLLADTDAFNISNKLGQSTLVNAFSNYYSGGYNTRFKDFTVYRTKEQIRSDTGFYTDEWCMGLVGLYRWPLFQHDRIDVDWDGNTDEQIDITDNQSYAVRDAFTDFIWNKVQLE